MFGETYRHVSRWLRVLIAHRKVKVLQLSESLGSKLSAHCVLSTQTEVSFDVSTRARSRKGKRDEELTKEGSWRFGKPIAR